MKGRTRHHLVGLANIILNFTKVRMEEKTMATLGKTLRSGVTAALLMAGTTTMSQGQFVSSESGPEVGPGGDWAIQLR